MFRPACLALVALSFIAAPSQELVLQKAGTQQYHRPGCAAIGDGRGVLAMTRAQAEARGLKPHADCDPAQTKAQPTGSPAAAAGSSPPSFVFVDAAKEPTSDRRQHYHREKCAALGKERRKLSVDEAAKQYWPCPKCRPPIRRRK